MEQCNMKTRPCLFWPLLLFCLLGAQPFAGADPLRVVLLTGLNNHDWRKTTPEVAAALQESGRFTVTEVSPPSPADTAASEAFRIDLKDTDVIVNNWTDFPVKLEPGKKGVFPWMDQVVNFVRQGGGYVGIHAASFERHPEFLRLAGLGWRDPAAGDRITVDAAGKLVRTPRGQGPGSGHGVPFAWTVTTRAAHHPITDGLPASWLHGRDELWHGVRGPAEGMELLATAYSPVTQTNEPVQWTVRYGKGRVFVTLLGHDAQAMQCPGFRHTLARGAEWAATGQVTLKKPADFPGPAPTAPTSAK
jgi:type 1 glutamine amidotransferase